MSRKGKAIRKTTPRKRQEGDRKSFFYILCVSSPNGQEAQYAGRTCRTVEQRLSQHLSGRGSKLIFSLCTDHGCKVHIQYSECFPTVGASAKKERFEISERQRDLLNLKIETKANRHKSDLSNLENAALNYERLSGVPLDLEAVSERKREAARKAPRQGRKDPLQLRSIIPEEEVVRATRLLQMLEALDTCHETNTKVTNYLKKRVRLRKKTLKKVLNGHALLNQAIQTSVIDLCIKLS